MKVKPRPEEIRPCIPLFLQRHSRKYETPPSSAILCRHVNAQQTAERFEIWWVERSKNVFLCRLFTRSKIFIDENLNCNWTHFGAYSEILSVYYFKPQSERSCFGPDITIGYSGFIPLGNALFINISPKIASYSSENVVLSRVIFAGFNRCQSLCLPIVSPNVDWPWGTKAWWTVDFAQHKARRLDSILFV